MAKLKKSKSKTSKLKTSKNLVTVAVVLTVASVVIYLLSLLEIPRDFSP